MKRPILTLIYAACSIVPVRAQLFSPNEAGVAAGHLHVVWRDIDADRKVFVTMGGKVVKFGERENVIFPGIVILFLKADPTGPSIGSVVNHIGFLVPNVAESAAKWKVAGLKVDPGINNRPDQAYVTTPGGLRIEILEDKNSTVPIHFQHIHFWVPESAIPEIQAWYAKVFGAKPGLSAGGAVAADIPGVKLIFAKADGPMAPTKGRGLDHIGFEVKNLEAFSKKLEASGVKLDRPFGKNPLGIGTALLTDPWGTQIELTEGWGKLTEPW